MSSTNAVSAEVVPEFFDLVKRQRACRDFSNKEVSDWHVQKLLEAAVRAPSAKNLQPWKFVVLRDSRRRINLVKVMRELWEGGARSATLELVPDALFKEVDDGFMSTYANAPVLILVAGDTEQESLEHLGWSIFPAVQNLLLGATALGLGSALTTLAAFRATDVQKIVDLPSSIVPMAVVPIGWPTRPLGQSKRLPVEEKACLDSYGNAWPVPVTSEATS